MLPNPTPDSGVTPRNWGTTLGSDFNHQRPFRSHHVHKKLKEPRLLTNFTLFIPKEPRRVKSFDVQSQSHGAHPFGNAVAESSLCEHVMAWFRVKPIEYLSVLLVLSIYIVFNTSKLWLFMLWKLKWSYTLGSIFFGNGVVSVRSNP